MNRNRLRLLMIAAVLILFGSQSTKAGTKIFVGSKSAGQSVSMDKIDHSAWNAILQKYVDSDGMVDYRGLNASSADIRRLDSYVKHLSSASTRVSASHESTLAFWINTYNAVTLHGMLKQYPTTSIRNHTAKLWGYNIWKDLQVYVGGQPYSLEGIEHEILRKKGDPRIHFAIVCASIGCPRLLNEAYVGDRLEEQLETNARDFFSRPGNFQHDPSARQFSLSSIMDWFAEDFGGDRSAQLRKIAAWLPSEQAKAAALAGSVSVAYLDYNWGLNEQKVTRTAKR